MATHDQVLQEDLHLQLRAEFGHASRVRSRRRRGSKSGAHKRDWSDKEIDGITNPLIAVRSALYGAAGSAAVDVTANVQALFDLEYAASWSINFALSMRSRYQASIFATASGLSRSVF